MRNIANEFYKLTLSDLFNYFQRRGYSKDQPLLISLDGDKTIIDRDKGAHFMSRAVVKMFKKLKGNQQFIVAMNTGRDLFNYLPLQKQTGHKEPNIFLSGRVIKRKDKIWIDKKALLSIGLKKKLWRRFISGFIPFLDVKHSLGNTFFVSGRRHLEKYYGHHRPIDWFKDLKINIIDIDKNKMAENIFQTFKIVRIEVPVLRNNETIELIKAINKEHRGTVKKITRQKFSLETESKLMFIPAPANKSRGERLTKQIASVRLLVADRYVNKGTGLKKLAKMLKVSAANIIYFGDSAADKANDIIVKAVLPRATLIMTNNAEANAKKYADFTVESVAKDGVPKAVDKLIEFQKRYSKIKN